MSRPPKRSDKRIAARIETLAHLFDVPLGRIEKAAAEGRIKPSEAVFGVPLFHVATIERAIFGTAVAMEKTHAIEPAIDEDRIRRRIAEVAKASKARSRRGPAA